MNATQRQWNLLSQRLGVKPKQFAMLLGVLAVAVVGLGFRFAPRGSKPIPQASNANPSTEIVPNQSQSSDSRATTIAYPSADSDPASRVIEMTFDNAPLRDPFRAVGAPESETTRVAYAPVVTLTKVPGLLPGLMLKAVIRGELAVFGDQTVRVGDAIALPDGTFASVRAIADRSVTVDYDGRVIEVCFGAASQSKATSIGGLK
ncbi:MAG: hypothetical protein EXS12_01580 [Phycisphaerales bacterium]|nr:hypothetical protein [Phycisphaerales bacterium]